MCIFSQENMLRCPWKVILNFRVLIHHKRKWTRALWDMWYAKGRVDMYFMGLGFMFCSLLVVKYARFLFPTWPWISVASAVGLSGARIASTSVSPDPSLIKPTLARAHDPGGFEIISEPISMHMYKQPQSSGPQIDISKSQWTCATEHTRELPLRQSAGIHQTPCQSGRQLGPLHHVRCHQTNSSAYISWILM